jgi:hypothetical protein
MDQLKFQLDMVSLDCNIALSKLEEAKAAERTKELEYQKARFQQDWLTMAAKQQQEQAQAQQQAQK